MKKISNKTLSFLLLAALAVSCFSAAFGASADTATDKTYTYEQEETVTIPLDPEYWQEIYNTDSGNFTLAAGENSLTQQKYLNIKSNTTAAGNKTALWAPYENKDTKTLFDPATVKKIEVTAIYNSIYTKIPFCINAEKTMAYVLEGAGQKLPSNNRTVNLQTQEIKYASSQGFQNADPAYDFSCFSANSTVKAVFEPYPYLDAFNRTVYGAAGSVYNVVEGKDELMYTMTQRGTMLLYPAIGFLSTSANIEIQEFKVTYMRTVDVTAEVKAVTERYPTLAALTGVADINTANAATLLNEIKDFTAAYSKYEENLQAILKEIGIYNEQQLQTYTVVAQQRQAGVVGQYFTTDISQGQKIDDMWSLLGGTLDISNGLFHLNSINTKLNVKGLSTAPKSLVIKARFNDLTGHNMSAGLRLQYAQKCKDNGNDNISFWIQIPEYKEENRIIVKPVTAQEISIQSMRINSTDQVTWESKNIQYPETEPLVIGEYISDVYTPNTITVTVDYIYNAAKNGYTLTFTVSDGERSVTQPTNALIPADATDFSLNVSGLPYTNEVSYYQACQDYGYLESVEYLMPENGLTAPTVDGVRFADVAKGDCDIAFQITSNVGQAPEGYKPVAYGAHLITNQKLLNPLDIISKDYKGKGDLPVFTAQKVLKEGETVPATYLASVKDSANKTTASGVSYKGVRFAAIGFVIYEAPNGEQVTVYSQNTDENKAVSCGQGNRSIIGVAKKIAAHEIANMQGKAGAADEATIAAVRGVINQTTPTTSEQQDQLISFVCTYQNFIDQQQ